MSSYLRCGKNTESKNPKPIKTKNGRIMISWNCAEYGSKKSRFIKEQEAIGILDSITKTLSKIHIVGHILF